MNYMKIVEADTKSGIGYRVTIFVSGCSVYPHCDKCSNKEAWDFNSGKPFTEDTKKEILYYLSKPYISGFSILGGEPLIERNKEDMIDLCSSIKEIRPDIKIWVYTGNIFENVKNDWYELLYNYVDVLVDGPYVDSKRDLRLKFRGSSNQRVIDVHKTYCEDKVIELI